MIPYLLTVSSDTKGVARFSESIKNLGEVEHIAVQFNPESNQFKTHTKINIPFPGHINKLSYVPRDLDLDRYVIFSDTDDVIFQKPFPEFTSDLYLACENVPHSETIWLKFIDLYPQFEVLRYKEVYNCGNYAMKVKTMYEMLDFLKDYECSDFRKYGFEQLHFNMFVEKRKDLSRVIDLEIFAPLYRNYNDKLVVKTDLWRYSNKVISCVHANGCHKELL